ncbi:MAG TPA: super-infection exclusion protein B [Bryobacteraceae bacterium]|nr:super-infection exclusion protein B [Bryobacteraceae bacterium]
MEILKKLVEWLREPTPRVAGGVLLASVIVLLLIHSNSGPEGLKETVRSHEGFVWLALILSGSMLLIFVIEATCTLVRASAKRRSKRRAMLRRLSLLTVEERHALQPAIESGRRTFGGHPEDRVLAALRGEGIVKLVTPYGYCIADDAWEMLVKAPRLVETPGHPRPPKTGREWMLH